MQCWTFENRQSPVHEGNFQQGLRDVKDASALFLFQILNKSLLELSNEVLHAPPAQGAEKLDVVRVRRL